MSMDDEKNATGVIGPPSNIGIEFTLSELPTGECMVGMDEKKRSPWNSRLGYQPWTIKWPCRYNLGRLEKRKERERG